MSVFRYYIPGKSMEDLSVELLKELGLADRLWDCLSGNLRDCLGMCNVHAKGPDGSSGLLICPMPVSGEPVPRQGWHQDQEAVDHGAYWIVRDPQYPPTPSALERKQIVDGYVRKLGDGSYWMCPTVRSQFDQTDLPKYYAQQDGDILIRIQPRYVAIWTASVKWCLRFLEQARDLPSTKFLGIKEAFDGAVQCLSLNYRVSAEELSLMPELLTDQSITDILDAAIDWDFYADVDNDPQKKTSMQAVSDIMQSLLHGPEDSTADTDQPEPPSSYSGEDMQLTTAADSHSSHREE